MVKEEYSNKLLPKFLFQIAATFKSELERLSGKTSFNFVSVGTLKDIEIPLPPLSIQQQIVDKIESYQAIISGAKQVVQNYKPQIDIDDDWEMVELREVCKKIADNIDPNKFSGKIKYIGLENIESNTGVIVGEIEKDYGNIKSTKTKFAERNILYGKLRPNLNKVYLSKIKGICSTDIMVLKTDSTILMPEFLYQIIRENSFNEQVLLGLKGAQLPRISFDYFSSIQIPLPPLSIQQQIVNRIEQEQQLVNANKELIKIYEQKIKDEINKLWKPEVKEYKVDEEKVSMAAEE